MIGYTSDQSFSLVLREKKSTFWYSGRKEQPHLIDVISRNKLVHFSFSSFSIFKLSMEKNKKLLL